MEEDDEPTASDLEFLDDDAVPGDQDDHTVRAIRASPAPAPNPPVAGRMDEDGSEPEEDNPQREPASIITTADLDNDDPWTEARLCSKFPASFWANPNRAVGTWMLTFCRTDKFAGGPPAWWKAELVTKFQEARHTDGTFLGIPATNYKWLTIAAESHEVHVAATFMDPVKREPMVKNSFRAAVDMGWRGPINYQWRYRRNHHIPHAYLQVPNGSKLLDRNLYRWGYEYQQVVKYSKKGKGLSISDAFMGAIMTTRMTDVQLASFYRQPYLTNLARLEHLRATLGPALRPPGAFFTPDFGPVLNPFQWQTKAATWAARFQRTTDPDFDIPGRKILILAGDSQVGKSTVVAAIQRSIGEWVFTATTRGASNAYDLTSMVGWNTQPVVLFDDVGIEANGTINPSTSAVLVRTANVADFSVRFGTLQTRVAVDSITRVIVTTNSTIDAFPEQVRRRAFYCHIVRGQDAGEAVAAWNFSPV